MWSEAIEGTNGIGSGIAEERPITIHRNQHFRSRHSHPGCSGVPVFGVDGRLMAVLDVSAIALRPMFQKPLKEKVSRMGPRGTDEPDRVAGRSRLT